MESIAFSRAIARVREGLGMLSNVKVQAEVQRLMQASLAKDGPYFPEGSRARGKPDGTSQNLTFKAGAAGLSSARWNLKKPETHQR